MGSLPTDSTPDVYIFGYQSILARGSLASTIGTAHDDSALIPAQLLHHRRTWSAVRDFSAHDSKRYVHTPDWSIASRVAFANIEPAEGLHVNGICQRIHPDALSDLDYREQGYRREDVTASIRTYAGHSLPDHARCYAYVDPAPDRSHTPISTRYYRMGLDGAAALTQRIPGFLQTYLDTTEPPGDRLDEQLAFVYFSRDGRHLWLLNEADSSLVLLLRCAQKQTTHDEADPDTTIAELSRPITPGLAWLDVRHRDGAVAQLHTRIPADLAQALLNLPHTPAQVALHSSHWLVRLALTQDSRLTEAGLLQLAQDRDHWVRRAAQRRLQDLTPAFQDPTTSTSGHSS